MWLGPENLFRFGQFICFWVLALPPVTGSSGGGSTAIRLRVPRLWECGEAVVRLLGEVHLEQIFAIAQCVEGVSETHPALHSS